VTTLLVEVYRELGPVLAGLGAFGGAYLARRRQERHFVTRAEFRAIPCLMHQQIPAVEAGPTAR
jgi:hypothetical protein